MPLMRRRVHPWQRAFRLESLWINLSAKAMETALVAYGEAREIYAFSARLATR